VADLTQMIDRDVSLEGTARNAAGGAVVLTDDRTPVYIAGLESWDRATDGKKVKAKGKLRRLGGQPVVNSQGEHSHGFPSDRFVLEQASWTVG
jgi:hypothetical protein